MLTSDYTAVDADKVHIRYKCARCSAMAAVNNMCLDYLSCDCDLRSADSWPTRDREMEVADWRMAFHLRNSC